MEGYNSGLMGLISCRVSLHPLLQSESPLPLDLIDKLREQILSQIMEHIKANTCQKGEGA
jgi:hypothetical protein